MRTLRSLAAVTIALFALCGEACAHPLGNFSVNHLTVVSPAPGRVELRYVLDLAEIPTFALLREYDPAGRPGPAAIATAARRQALSVLPQLHVRFEGRELPLALDDARATLRRGAGGLPTFYLTAVLHADLAASAGSMTPPAGGGSLRVVDDSFAERIGWHDVVLAGTPEPTRALTAYPPVEAGSPRSVRAIRVDDPWSPAAHAVVAESESGPREAAPAATIRSNQLAELLARGTSDPAIVAFALLAAFGLGMLHALEPGHGKALMAVSLVGARATVKQAAILALALTVAHTAAVVLLGLGLHLFKGAFVPERIYPWIALASGLTVACVAALALARNFPRARNLPRLRIQPRARRVAFLREAHVSAHVHHTHAGDVAPARAARSSAHAAHPHAHHSHLADSRSHDSHSHDGHSHDDAGHSHAIPGAEPMRFGPAVLAAVSGGIAPCPAALVVLLASLALGQATYGLAMVLTFSLGLALTLTGIGIGVVRGARLLSGFAAFDRLLPYAPLASALAMAVVGALLVERGLVDLGALPS